MAAREYRSLQINLFEPMLVLMSLCYTQYIPFVLCCQVQGLHTLLIDSTQRAGKFASGLYDTRSSRQDTILTAFSRALTKDPGLTSSTE
jgi:hypothetical protein